MSKLSLFPKIENPNPKDCALIYSTLGWQVFPVYEMTDSVCSCNEKENCPNAGKHPRTNHGYEEASNDRSKIEYWWTKWPKANVGIATGRSSGITVVDADASNGKPGVINLTTLCAPHGGVPGTVVANSGGGGLHLYFQYCETLHTSTGTRTTGLAEAIDVKNDLGYIIAPPSNHKSGGTYKWRAITGELLTVPDWLTSETPQRATVRRKSHQRGKPGYKLEKIASMLSVISPEDRDRWLKVGLILGRLYVGSGQENDAWAVYEAWASRSEKFDEDRAGNLVRMREMFNDRSQESTRAGAAPLSVGSLILWAREAGWNPFGERKLVDYEPGNEFAMAEALVEALVGLPENRHFNVMGQVRDVLRAVLPSALNIKTSSRTGEKPTETLIVRATTSNSLLAAFTREVAMRTTDKSGAPIAVTIPFGLATIALNELTAAFPPLVGLTQWPMVDVETGELIIRPTGYDSRTGLYFEIDSKLKIDETIKPTVAWKALREELLVDFPFENELMRAGALGMMISMMQRQLMTTCPGFAVVAPQPGSGKSTLVEVAALIVHGESLPTQAWSLDPEELRKALHSILMSKAPAVLFDNVTRGASIDSDHLAKLLTSERSADRVLGASEIRKEMNTLLVTFTGNNIAFARDLASRVIVLRLNAESADPLQREFRNKNIWDFALKNRSKWLSCLIAILRGGLNFQFDAGQSRFPAFDQHVARVVMATTGQDLRTLLMENDADDADDHEAQRNMMSLMWVWQEQWRGPGENGHPWRVADLMAAVEDKTFDEKRLHVLQRGAGDPRTWERDPARALGQALKALNGNYRFAPMVALSTLDRHSKSNFWHIKGGPTLPTMPEIPATGSSTAQRSSGMF